MRAQASARSRTALRRAATATLAALLAGTAACAATTPTTRESPVEVDAHVTSADLERVLGNGLRFIGHGDFGLERAELVAADDAPGGVLLRVHYPAGSASRRAGGTDGGMQAYLRLPDDPVTALDLEYHVRFPSDFDFVKGGKLPGLYGGTVASGFNIPDGTDGFSTRYMWRSGGDGEVYAYLPTSVEHGTSLGAGCWSFPQGRWTSIRQRVLLNTPGQADGRVLVWQDGRLVLDSTGLTFRTTGELHIDGLFFSTFFGGSDTSWASPVDQYADFAGFTLSDTSDVPAASPTPTGCGTGGAP